MDLVWKLSYISDLLTKIESLFEFYVFILSFLRSSYSSRIWSIESLSWLELLNLRGGLFLYLISNLTSLGSNGCKRSFFKSSTFIILSIRLRSLDSYNSLWVYKWIPNGFCFALYCLLWSKKTSLFLGTLLFMTVTVSGFSLASSLTLVL